MTDRDVQADVGQTDVSSTGQARKARTLRLSAPLSKAVTEESRATGVQEHQLLVSLITLGLMHCGTFDGATMEEWDLLMERAEASFPDCEGVAEWTLTCIRKRSEAGGLAGLKFLEYVAFSEARSAARRAARA